MQAEDLGFDVDLSSVRSDDDLDGLGEGGGVSDAAAKPGQSTAEEADPYVVNPLSGEIFDTRDLDSVLAGLFDLKDQISELQEFQRMLREVAVSFTTAETKTRRLQGHRYKATVTMPDKDWNPSKLKTLWEQFPEIRDEYLRISSVKPKLREVNKLRNTDTSDSDLAIFKGLLMSAESEPTATARVSVERMDQ